jgi:hypothetical protein
MTSVTMNRSLRHVMPAHRRMGERRSRSKVAKRRKVFAGLKIGENGLGKDCAASAIHFHPLNEPEEEIVRLEELLQSQTIGFGSDGNRSSDRALPAMTLSFVTACLSSRTGSSRLSTQIQASPESGGRHTLFTLGADPVYEKFSSTAMNVCRSPWPSVSRTRPSMSAR